MSAVSGDHRVSQAVPLRSIQILRAVAACLVVFGHALHETADISARTGRPPLNVNVIDWGIGVDIFFVISGFIMIYTTAELFGQPGAMRTFLMRRIIRALGAALAVALGPFWGIDQILPRCVSGGLPAMLIVAAAAFGPRLSASWIVTPLVVLGDASYSLYLTHPFAIRPMRNIWMALDGSALPFSLFVMLCLLAAIAAALVVYRWIERPITDVLRSRLGSRGTSRPRRLAGTQPQSAAAGG
jgi:peptidoglycan/LPS O-acetylase OafA/YrhL